VFAFSLSCLEIFAAPGATGRYIQSDLDKSEIIPGGCRQDETCGWGYQTGLRGLDAFQP